MSADIPQWLVTSVVDAFAEAGATGSLADLEQEAEALLQVWNGLGDQVRDLRYLLVYRERLDAFQGATANLHLLWLAAVYSGLANDLTLDLVDLSRAPQDPHREIGTRLEKLGVSAADAHRVEELVFKLGEPDPPVDDLEAQLLVDAALAIFATSPQNYLKLVRRIRAQFPNMDDQQFLSRRRRVIDETLGRPHLFLTPFGAHWTATVRENLIGERSRIDAELGRLASPPQPEPQIRERNVDPASVRTDTTVIRRSHHQKESRLAAKSRVKPTADNRTENLAPTDERSDSLRERDADETSTLESYSDLFAHRRGRHENLDG